MNVFAKSTHTTTGTCLAATLILALAACSAGEEDGAERIETEPAAASAAQTATSTLAIAERLGVPNARMPVDHVVTAGQPSDAQVEALLAGGVEHVVSLRPAGESGAGWEEAHAEELGYDFHRLPIAGAGSLTRENVEAFAAILDATGEDETLLYCASSNRVGALLALKAYWVDGIEPERALELGLAGGMTGLTPTVTGLLGL